MSSDIKVHGAIRDQPGCSMMGQAAGTAAVQSIRTGQPANDLDTEQLVLTLRKAGANLPQTRPARPSMPVAFDSGRASNENTSTSFHLSDHHASLVSGFASLQGRYPEMRLAHLGTHEGKGSETVGSAGLHHSALENTISPPTLLSPRGRMPSRRSAFTSSNSGSDTRSRRGRATSGTPPGIHAFVL